MEISHPGQEIIEIAEKNQNQENGKIVNQDVGNSSGSNKRRKSIVWEEMTKHKGEDGKVRAICKHCQKAFDGSSKKGTTHLKNHLERCRVKRNTVEDADKPMKTSDSSSLVVIKEKSVIDLIENCFHPYRFPTNRWDPSVLKSRKVERLQVYEDEKDKLRKFLSQLSSRFCLTVDWASGWYLLTAHYIDDSWKPKRKIIDFKNAQYDFWNFIATLKDTCLDLKIEGNICSVVDAYEIEDDDDDGYAADEDNDEHDDVIGYVVDDDDDDHDDVTGEINSWFSQRGSPPFGGYLFYIHPGLFDILDYLYSRMDNWVRDTCDGMKQCIRYLNKSPGYRFDTFQMAIDNAKFKGKKGITSAEVHLPLKIYDFEDFEILMGCKEAFFELEQIDPNFKSANLTKTQWDQATLAYEHWKELKDIDRSLSEINYTTPNLYFAKFCDLFMKLLPRERSECHHNGKRTSPLIKKFPSIRQKFFDKYWIKSKLVLVIAVILDPRFKMEIVELWYNKIYGIDADYYIKKIVDDFTNAYNEYAKGSISGDATYSASYLDTMGRPCSSSHEVSQNSELDRYLNEPKFPSIEKFDVLAWWRVYSPIFPALARMARDFLTVTIFGTGILKCPLDKEIDCIVGCGDLDDDIKRALVCLRRWLESPEK